MNECEEEELSERTKKRVKPGQEIKKNKSDQDKQCVCERTRDKSNTTYIG